MSYNVQSLFSVDDKQATTALTRLIGKLDAADVAVNTLNASITLTMKSMVGLADVTKILGISLGEASKMTSNLNRTLGNTEARGMAAATGLKSAADATNMLEVSTALANEELSLTAKYLQEIKLNSKIAFGVGPVPGGGGRGGGAGAKIAEEGIMARMIGGAGGLLNKGLGIAIGGMIAKDLAKAGMEPALEYKQQMGGLKGTGLSDAQMAQARMTAESITKELPTTTVVDNLKTIKEMFGITRDFNDALKISKDYAKMSVALEFAGNKVPGLKGHSADFGQAVAKGAEMLGMVKPEQIKEYMDEAMKSYIGTGGLVNPLMTAQAIKFSRSAKVGKDNDWTFGVLTYLLEESGLGKSGGGSAGVGPMVKNLDTLFGQGKGTKPTLAGLRQLGLMPTGKEAGQVDTTTLTTMVTGKLKGWNEFIANPFKWYVKYLKPALAKQAFPGASDVEALKGFEGLNQTQQLGVLRHSLPGIKAIAEDPLVQFMTKEHQIEKFMTLRKQQADVEKMYAIAQEETGFKAMEASARFQDLQRRIGLGLSPAIDRLLDGLNSLFGLFVSLDGKMPQTADALGKLNQQLFGLKGTFSSIGKALGEINWEPFFKFLDKAGAHVIRGATGIAKGMQSHPARAIGMAIGGTLGALAGGIGGSVVAPGPGTMVGVAGGGALGELAGAAAGAPFDDMIQKHKAETKAKNQKAMDDMHGIHSPGSWRKSLAQPGAMAPVNTYNSPITVNVNGPGHHPEALKEAAHAGAKKALDEHTRNTARATKNFISSAWKAGGDMGNPVYATG